MLFSGDTAAVLWLEIRLRTGVSGKNKTKQKKKQRNYPLTGFSDRLFDPGFE